MKKCVQIISKEFSREEIIFWSNEYNCKNKDTYAKFSFKPKNKEFLDKKEFIKIAMWKSPRGKKHYNNNDSKFVEEIFRIAFSKDTSEETRVKILQLLNGVGYPMASALLHFGFDSENYPIIDFRALWSLYGTPRSEVQHNYKRWHKYRSDCIDLAKASRVKLRVLDKALWQYSHDNQSKIDD